MPLFAESSRAEEIDSSLALTSCTTAFQESRFCPRRSLWIVLFPLRIAGGGDSTTMAGRSGASPRALPARPAGNQLPCPSNAADAPPGGERRRTSGGVERSLSTTGPEPRRALRYRQAAPGERLLYRPVRESAPHHTPRPADRERAPRRRLRRSPRSGRAARRNPQLRRRL